MPSLKAIGQVCRCCKSSGGDKKIDLTSLRLDDDERIYHLGCVNLRSERRLEVDDLVFVRAKGEPVCRSCRERLHLNEWQLIFGGSVFHLRCVDPFGLVFYRSVDEGQRWGASGKWIGGTSPSVYRATVKRRKRD